MTAWLNAHLTSWVYLTTAAAATGLLLILWLTRPYRVSANLLHLKHARRNGGSMHACVALVLATWAAVAMRNEWNMNEPTPLITAVAIFGLCWLTLTFTPIFWHAWQTRQCARVAKRCVGQIGKVYQSITSDAGSVEIEQGSKRLRLPALSQTGEPLPAFCDVEVTGINDAGVLWVIRLM